MGVLWGVCSEYFGESRMYYQRLQAEFTLIAVGQTDDGTAELDDLMLMWRHCNEPPPSSCTTGMR